MVTATPVEISERWNYAEMLLDADPSKNMVEKYLFEGEMFVFADETNGLIVGETVCLQISENEIEIKNLAVKSSEQGKGYGKKIIKWIVSHFQDKSIIVGSSEKGKEFYEKCGFVSTHILPNFFIDNYEEKIYEDEKQVVDMYMLKYIQK